MARYKENYGSYNTYRRNTRFTLRPADEEPYFRPFNTHARARAQSWHREREREVDFFDPHDDYNYSYRSLDVPVQTTARFRANPHDYEINNDDYRDRHYSNYSYQPNRSRIRSISYPNRIPFRSADQWENHRNRQSENGHFLTNEDTFVPRERTFTNTQYKTKTQNWASNNSLVRAIPNNTNITDRIYDDFDTDPPNRRNTRTKRKNRKKAQIRRMEAADRGEDRFRDPDRLRHPPEYDVLEREDHMVSESVPFRPEIRNGGDAHTDGARFPISRNMYPDTSNSNARRDVRTHTAPKVIYRDRPKRRPQQNKRPQRYFDKQNRTKNNNTNYTPASPRLRAASKLMYDLIRFVHHLEKVTTKVTNNTPVTFKRLTQHLTDSIKPAMPNEKIKNLLEGNAKNWAYTAQQILEEHYETLVDVTLAELKERTEQSDWHQAFGIAKGWANKNYKQRIHVDTYTRVEALFTTELCEDFERRDVVRQSHTIRTRAPHASEPTGNGRQLQTVRPKKGSTHVEVQTTPRLRTNADRGPATPPNRGDWSFDSEFPPLEPRPTLQPTPVAPRSPRAQRQPRRILTEALTQVEDQPETLIRVEDQPETSHVQAVETNLKLATEKATTLPSLLPLDIQTDVQDADSVVEEGATAKPVDTRIQTVTTETQRKLPAFVRVVSSPVIFSDDSEEYQFSLYSSDPTIKTQQQKLAEKEGNEIEEGQTERNVQEKDRACTSTSLQIESIEPTVTLEKIPQAPRTPTTPSVGRPCRHINTERKQIDWSLNLKKRYVIIGDSNVSRIPAFGIPDLQIDSFPGAKFQHAGNLVERATVALEPEILIMSFGINNRTQRCFTRASQEIHRAYRLARTRLPHTEILIPVINFSDLLAQEEQILLQEINEYIKSNINFLDALPSHQFEVERDMVHWTSDTARAILEHWVRALNL